MAAKDLVEGSDGRLRCPWAGSQPDYLAYHDLEWGRPVHDELRLFEKLCLEGFQARLVWAHAPARHRAPRRSGQVPASIPESTALAVELKRRGFRMVGATTVYAMMQACGVVNDHLTGCFVRDELDATPRPPSRLSSRGPGPDSGSPGGPGPPLGYLGQGIWGERW